MIEKSANFFQRHAKPAQADGRTERESVGFTEKWFHGIIVSERKGYCEAIFLRGREAEWEVI
ncbi:hypothetical protein G5A92_07310 [Blautia massiliensis]|uniref:hypothetical protein n=1 Tax=Blautia TaxID=572511 RepID=UPI00156E0AED|nr:MULTISPECIES: hypothetical protein [Blautia]MCC2725962.1 hypothetical protein [Blautia sp. MSK22_86]NSF56857.1 hypothetical protein [Blautia massiliensis (ex Durand et al. 2017)]NSK72202.1 hypothetical protein [Blautia massiliensis (ex Durand et al. 2017)]